MAIEAKVVAAASNILKAVGPHFEVVLSSSDVCVGSGVGLGEGVFWVVDRRCGMSGRMTVGRDTLLIGTLPAKGLKKPGLHCRRSTCTTGVSGDAIEMLATGCRANGAC